MCTPVPSRSGRTGVGHLRVCWSLTQSVNLLRSATIIYNVSAELPKKELAMHIHKLLAVTVKNYLDTT